MLRNILSLALLITLGATSVLQANPSPHSKSSSRKKAASKSASKVEPATTLASGWSYSNGVWTHVNGYKLVNGQVVRSGVQTHEKVPAPPTKAEMDAALRKKPATKTAAETASEKEAQRQRNLAPRPAPQTGSHL